MYILTGERLWCLSYPIKGKPAAFREAVVLSFSTCTNPIIHFFNRPKISSWGMKIFQEKSKTMPMQIFGSKRGVLPILQLNNICNFFNHNLFHKSSQFCQNQKLNMTQNKHVFTSGLESFLISTSYNVHVMSIRLKIEKYTLFQDGGQ